MSTRRPSVRVLSAEGDSASGRVLVSAYTAAVVAAQVVLGSFGPTAGLVANALLLLALLNHSLFRGRLREELNPRRPVYSRSADALATLSLLPLLALLRATLPVQEQSVASYALLTLAMLVAAILIARPAPVRSLVALFAVSRDQLLFGVTGWPLGVAAYAIIRPSPLPGESLGRSAPAAVVVLLAAGFVWELVFRGMLQPILGTAVDRSGVWLGAAVSAAAGAGTGSLGYAVVMGGTGLLFGWYAARSGSILGTSLAHGTLNVGLVLAGPALL